MIRPKSEKFIRGRSLRRQVFERDHGICAMCGLDTEAVLGALRRVEETMHEESARLLLRRQVLRESFGTTRRPFWEAHHKDAVADGGGNTGIENLVTLCHRCHLKATRERTRK